LRNEGLGSEENYKRIETSALLSKTVKTGLFLKVNLESMVLGPVILAPQVKSNHLCDENAGIQRFEYQDWRPAKFCGHPATEWKT